MNTYQVVRPFGEHQIGDTLQESDFLSPQRVNQLIQQRYVVLVATEEQAKRRGRKKADDE